MCYALSHEQGGLRCWICPESTHSSWNCVKNAVRRSSLQHVLLLSSCMSNCMHWPYKSARNLQTLQEAAQFLGNNISQDAFEELQDAMSMDMGVEVDSDEIPQDPSQIPFLPCVSKLSTFVPRLTVWSSQDSKK